MTAPSTAIQVTGLRKSYGELLVLDGIDLEVPAGTVFALLGPNGAGKTTAVHILTTLLTPDAGEVAVGGHDLRTDPEGIRSQIGVTGQFSAVDDLLTGEENLRLMAALHHLGREGRPAADRGPARALRADGRGRQARGHLLRRHEAAAGPRHDPDGQPADRVPGRADQRRRPPRAADDVADRERPRRRRDHHLPDHAVPGGGR